MTGIIWVEYVAVAPASGRVRSHVVSQRVMNVPAYDSNATHVEPAWTRSSACACRPRSDRSQA